jgi:hypothetical protein
VATNVQWTAWDSCSIYAESNVLESNATCETGRNRGSTQQRWHPGSGERASESLRSGFRMSASPQTLNRMYEVRTRKSAWRHCCSGCKQCMTIYWIVRQSRYCGHDSRSTSWKVRGRALPAKDGCMIGEREDACGWTP